MCGVNEGEHTPRSRSGTIPPAPPAVLAGRWVLLGAAAPRRDRGALAGRALGASPAGCAAPGPRAGCSRIGGAPSRSAAGPGRPAADSSQPERLPSPRPTEPRRPCGEQQLHGAASGSRDSVATPRSGHAQVAAARPRRPLSRRPRARGPGSQTRHRVCVDCHRRFKCVAVKGTSASVNTRVLSERSRGAQIREQ